jgi:hypothetical protein
MGILSLAYGPGGAEVEHSNSFDALGRWIAGIDAEPSAVATQFGSGVGSGAMFLEEGNINRQVFGAAGVSPGGLAADNVIAMFSIPANCFDVAGRGINVTACGKTVTSGTTKDIKIIFGCTTAVVGSTVTGGTTVTDTGSFTGAASVGGWQINANIFKFGAAGSNTQYGQTTGIVTGTTHLGINAPVFPTAPENAAILIAVTGNTNTTVTDIVLNFFEVNAMN